jgi:hypothetical protein
MPLPLDALVAQPFMVNVRAQEFDWDELLFEYELTLDDMQAWLRGLNEEQIHFKPGDQQFSITEVVTHSCSNDELVLGWLALLLQGRAAEVDPATLIGGAGARHAASLLDVEASNEACRKLARNTIEARPDPVDLAATTPHPYFGALNAKGWIYFMALHRGMHRRQCEQVIDAPGFPHSTSYQTQPREAYQPAARKTWLVTEAWGKPPAAGGKSGATAKQRTAPKKTAAKKKTASKSSKK